MKRKVYHVTAKGDDWKVKATDASRAAAIEENKADAVEKAKEMAKNHPLSQVVVHKRDRTIETEYTYGNDPRRYKG